MEEQKEYIDKQIKSMMETQDMLPMFDKVFEKMTFKICSVE